MDRNLNVHSGIASRVRYFDVEGLDMFLEVSKCTKNLQINAQLWSRNFKEESLKTEWCQWGLKCTMLVPILNVPGGM